MTPLAHWAYSRVSWNLGGGPPPDTGLAVGVGRPPSRPRTGDRCEEGLPEECCVRDGAGGARGGDGRDGRTGRRRAGGAARDGRGHGSAGDGRDDERRPGGGCGPKGKHDPARTAVRHGRGDGSVILGGRRVPVARPRMCAADGSGELAVASYELFPQTEVLGWMAMGWMLAGLSTRHYPAGLEPVGHRVTQTGRSTSKSAVSRRFVAATETALGELLSADLSGLDLVALMVDGVHFGDHLCVVALGVGIDPTKYPLGLAEGSTENTTVVTDLLTGLGDRRSARRRPSTPPDPARTDPRTASRG